MDPLSISFGVAGLMPLVANAIKLVQDYWVGVRGAKERVETLTTELEALQYNLNALQKLLDSHTHGSGSMASDESSVLQSCSAACRVKLEALIKRLERPGLAKGKMHALKWPFEEKEHKETISELHSLSAWMQFSLSIGGYRLLSSSSAQVLELLRGQLRHFEEIREHSVELRQELKEHREPSQDLRRERQDFLDWLSIWNIQAQHDKIQGARAQNTGSWFLQDETFLRWRADRADSHLLWCHGLPGSGKTVLCSLAVDDFLKESEHMSHVAFFYFNYREAEHQGPREVLSCLLRQVAATLDEIPSELMQMRLSKGKKSGQMNLEECKQMMAICLARTNRFYFVLDALDECDFSKHRKVLLNTLHDLAQLPQTRLLVTSRSHIQDIAGSFHEIPQMVIVAHDEDLQEYLSSEISASHGTDGLEEELAIRICSQIKRRANGMFLLAVLQLRFIIDEPTPGEMEDGLENMSEDLTGAFEETIFRIKNLPKSRAQLGMDILMWLCHAREALSISELRDALAFRKGQGSKLDKYRPSLNMMLECCHGLVVPSADIEYIELAHYSIQEYLRSNTARLFPFFEQEMVSTCLGYLMLDEFKSGPQAIHDGYNLIEKRLSNYPFASYAASFWDEHVGEFQATESIWPTLLDFVYGTEAIASSVQIRHFETGFVDIYVDPRECRSRKPLHYASSFGLEILLVTMLESPEASSTINSKTEVVGSTPIILAAASGHVKLVRLLLQHGADPYVANWYGNALYCAAEADQPEVIVELVASGMNPNGCNEYRKDVGPRRSPISCTLDRDSVFALATFVRLGASVNVDNDSGQLLLHRAATKEASKIIEYLVRNKLADINCKSNTGLTPLDCAISLPSTETIRTLMRLGADSRQISSRSLARLAELGFAPGS
ncbi:hypothetical protein Daus18300_011347 [Diaporthe australafricana]|uniref:NACHT domain-containing protein n=1 Tax=Diaporthe australafricana TaxID=127596 RepID=A0ABR3W720_9PEZI